jgi:hypothetical protein
MTRAKKTKAERVAKKISVDDGRVADIHRREIMTTTTKTIAEKLADKIQAELKGERWLTPQHREEILAESVDRVATRFGDTSWAFEDESYITETGEIWGVGYEGCWCVKEAGHHPECDNKEER